MFDMKKWSDDRRTIEGEIRGLKERQRESFQPRWRGYLDGPALLKAKKRATILYAIRAHRRGRTHSAAISAEAIAKGLAEYERAPSTPLPAASAVG
jgi:hypothetical protein